MFAIICLRHGKPQEADNTVSVVPHCEAQINDFRNKIIISAKLKANSLETSHHNIQRQYGIFGEFYEESIKNVLKE